MNFTKAVYKIVQKIPKGQTMTYTEVARAIGKPGATRAVGNALNRNHDPRIPCHRVICSDGTLGEYNRGVARKLELLKKEKAKLP